MSSRQNQNSYFTLLVEGYSFNPLYVGAEVPCFLVLILALQRAPVLACMAQHLLVELGGNLAMCQWEEGQLVSSMDVVFATPCYAGFKDSSLYVFLALVSGRGIE